MSTSGWRQIFKRLEATGAVDGLGGLEFRFKRVDPSLGSQLAARGEELGVLDRQGKFEAYLDACQKAPHASEGTKRKWRKALDL